MQLVFTVIQDHTSEEAPIPLSEIVAIVREESPWRVSDKPWARLFKEAPKPGFSLKDVEMSDSCCALKYLCFHNSKCLDAHMSLVE